MFLNVSNEDTSRICEYAQLGTSTEQISLFLQFIVLKGIQDSSLSRNSIFAIRTREISADLVLPDYHFIRYSNVQTTKAKEKPQEKRGNSQFYESSRHSRFLKNHTESLRIFTRAPSSQFSISHLVNIKLSNQGKQS